jgi:alkylation response protein AidB-like acyl-CoA dehydrogenase
MSHKERLWISFSALTLAAGQDAPDCDISGNFPGRAFDGLRALGILRNPPIAPSEIRTLLRVLAAIGRGNLSVGRIFEGHCNAIALIKQFGTSNQSKELDHLLAGGALLGVWNTDAPDAPVTVTSGRLTGKKNFASGVDGITHAIITAANSRQRQMLLLAVAQLPIDRTWWKPLGMRASGSHVVDLEGIPVTDAATIGADDDYIREPWFSAGAIRFLAVQVGGMQAVLDVTATHLRATKRGNNPYQNHRLGQMAVSIESGYHWLDAVAKRCAHPKHLSSAEVIASANAARVAIERGALEVLELAERSVGASGMIFPHPLERLIRDLRTYLRQPNPDFALSNVGTAVLEQTWSPGYDAN